MKKLIVFLMLLISCSKSPLINQDKSTDTGKRPYTGKNVKRVGGGRFPTLASVYSFLQVGDIVVINPGVYNEQFILQNGVTFVIDGVTFNYSDPDINKSTVTNNGIKVTGCVITGAGTLLRSGSQGSVVELNDSSVVSITNSVTIQDDQINPYGAYYGALRVEGGSSLTFDGNINAKGVGAYIRDGSFTGTGNLSSLLYNALQLGGNAAVVNFKGTAHSYGDYADAVQIGSGKLTFEGAIISEKYIALEQSGGSSVVNNTSITSNADSSDYTYSVGVGGDSMIFSNVNMLSKGTFSIGGYGVLTLSSPCFANKPPSLNVTIVNPGNLQIVL